MARPVAWVYVVALSDTFAGTDAKDPAFRVVDRVTLAALSSLPRQQRSVVVLAFSPGDRRDSQMLRRDRQGDLAQRHQTAPNRSDGGGS